MNAYLEGDINNAKFSSLVNTLLYDFSFNSLYVNDGGKFREIMLNNMNAPGITSLSPASGKSGDSITIVGTNFGGDPGASNRSTPNY